MKKWLLTGLMLFLIGLIGCTPSIYGVPQERWDTMGEQERVAVMEAYQARQAVLQQQREERARQQAIEREHQRAIEAEEARQRQLQVDAVYRGKGVYGDLLRVTIQDGRLKFRGDHKPYQPVAFKIAAGETKKVEVVDLRGRTANLLASYDGSNLLLDDHPDARRSHAARLVYEDGWEEGKTYANLNARGPLELRGVTVTVQVLGEPPRDRRTGRRPQVIVIQQPAPKPENPQIILSKEKEHRPQKPETVAVEAPPRHDKPEVVAREQPTYKKQRANVPPSRVKVTFNKGQIQIKGKSCPLTPQSIDLREGETRTIALQGPLGRVNVRVSYQGGEIAIDDHPGKGKADTRLSFSQEWRNGSTYRIKATESRFIEDLDISVLAM
ncbi:MAG TPA: hypothetical protein VD811_01985 [Desulfuromonadales bacterium]|nr:hypothetical protein [Desulfuromonadales bacterium]